jgi:hypothetical protein
VDSVSGRVEVLTQRTDKDVRLLGDRLTKIEVDQEEAGADAAHFRAERLEEMERMVTEIDPDRFAPAAALDDLERRVARLQDRLQQRPADPSRGPGHDPFPEPMAPPEPVDPVEPVEPAADAR